MKDMGDFPPIDEHLSINSDNIESVINNWLNDGLTKIEISLLLEIEIEELEEKMKTFEK